MKHLASLSQIAGALAVSVGVGLFSAPAGLVSVGIFLLTFGVAAEQGDD